MDTEKLKADRARAQLLVDKLDRILNQEARNNITVGIVLEAMGAIVASRCQTLEQAQIRARDLGVAIIAQYQMRVEKK